MLYNVNWCMRSCKVSLLFKWHLSLLKLNIQNCISEIMNYRRVLWLKLLHLKSLNQYKSAFFSGMTAFVFLFHWHIGNFIFCVVGVFLSFFKLYYKAWNNWIYTGDSPVSAVANIIQSLEAACFLSIKTLQTLLTGIGFLL